MSQVFTPPKSFDPLDMRNYTLEKLPEMKGGMWADRVKFAGVPLAIFFFLYFDLHWCGTIGVFETQTKVPPAHCYSALAIFVSSLILWLAESIPNYLTSFLIIVAAVLTGVMKMRPAFAMLGEPVMILNIASFIMASALVVTGLAKRICIYMVLRMGGNLGMMLLCFIGLNLLLGAFISATSAKTALLLPLFMVISAMYGATGGEHRNNVGRNMVLQNLLANNVSASAFITGSAANLVAANLLEMAGYKVYYADWLKVMLPLCVIQCLFAWYTGTRWIFPISKQDAVPKMEGGTARLHDELAKLGKISAAEIRAGVVFLAVLTLWASDKLIGVRAEVVALAGAICVLMPSVCKLPRLGVIKWNDADIPWHMLMFSWGAYVLGGLVEKTDIVGLWIHSMLDSWNADTLPKVVVFGILALAFGLTTLISESKTARTIVMFPIIIAVAKRFGWDVIGFSLPMAFLINQVYVLYFNSKPANISYLTNQYSSWESFKFGILQMLACIGMLILWTQYVMPLMGFDSRLW